METNGDSQAAWRERPVAVLVSGGLDSAILVAELCRSSPNVRPVYVRFGLVWEDVEQSYLQAFLDAVACPSLGPLKVFELNAGSIYGEHWSTTGQNTPNASSTDDAVFLPGRNLLLLAQTAIWCGMRDFPTIAMAPLKGNPFGDSTATFFDAFELVIRQSIDRPVRVERPYREMSKVEVMRRGEGLPLEKTFSCIRPTQGLHCGRCNKCAERQAAFRDALLTDPTNYASAVIH